MFKAICNYGRDFSEKLRGVGDCIHEDAVGFYFEEAQFGEDLWIVWVSYGGCLNHSDAFFYKSAVNLFGEETSNGCEVVLGVYYDFVNSTSSSSFRVSATNVSNDFPLLS